MGSSSVREFLAAPLRMRAYLGLAVLAALVLPVVLRDAAAPVPDRAEWLTVLALVGISALNIEVGRLLAGGLVRVNQAHKALSAWAFACALLLPPPWLLLIVPVTYAHARWRGIRVPLYKWIGSAGFLVLAGLAGALVTHWVIADDVGGTNWMVGNGGRGLVAILAGVAAFLAAETVLFHGSAYLNSPDDETWLRATLRSPSFYLTEAGVLVIGGLLCAVWTGGAWFVLLFLPIYVLAQRAALHEQVSATNVELERANRFKVDLMGMLGHEIGNPLTSVMGHAQVGSESLAEDDRAQAARSLTVIERNAAQIRLVLHDVLTLVASESGELVARPEPVEVEPAVRAAVAAIAGPPAPDLSDLGGVRLMVQPGHLDQILTNLLGNAAKYAGGATRVGASTRDGVVRLAIVDRGPGVPDSLRDQLFQRFSRGDDTSADVAGTGLGLFITRELARANGGDVSYRDAEGGGAVFEVVLPAAG